MIQGWGAKAPFALRGHARRFDAKMYTRPSDGKREVQSQINSLGNISCRDYLAKVILKAGGDFEAFGTQQLDNLRGVDQVFVKRV